MTTNDEKAVESARQITQYCKDHPNCKQCIFIFSQVCVLKWVKPDQWDESMSKVLDRKKLSRYTDKKGK